MDKCFKAGDVVVLKSGSPKMTVIYSNEESTSVVYYNYEAQKISSSATIISTIALEIYVA